MNSEAKIIIEKFGLAPHIEGGWYRFIWSGERKSASLIYYLLEGSDVSSWHKLHSDEIWVWNSGGSVKITLGGEGQTPQAEKEMLLGPRYADGESFQIIVPANNWQTARLINGAYALVSCIVSPAFHKDDFILYKGPLA